MEIFDRRTLEEVPPLYYKVFKMVLRHIFFNNVEYTKEIIVIQK